MSSLSSPRIHTRSPWPPRPYNPSPYLYFHFLCPLWCRCLVSFTHVEIWMWLTQQADPKPQRRGPHPVCCLCRFAPCSVFSVMGETFYITGKGTWMVALLVSLHVDLIRSWSFSTTTNTLYPPKLTTAVISPLLLLFLHLFILLIKSIKYSTSLYCSLFHYYYFFDHRKWRNSGQDWWSFDADGAIWKHE